MSTTLGETLRKVCVDVFLDLKSRLGEMKSQDAELRTEVMKLFLSRSKAKLIECYAITKWLSNRSVVNNLQGVSDFQNNIGKLENVLGQQMDEFYFSHAAIYSMRCRHIEVSNAAEILSSSKYKTLPMSVFSCGIPEIPSLRDTADTVKDLDVYIRTKLLSDESLSPLFSQYISVNGGILSVVVPNYFSLHLTLQLLNAESRWTVLGFQVLSIDSPNTPTQTSIMNFELLSRTVVEIVAELCSKEIEENDNNKRSVLSRILSLCRHTSLAASLRLMHRQAVDLAGGLWRGSVLVTFDESRWQHTADACSCLSLQLWKSQFSREHQIIVNVFLLNARRGSQQPAHTLRTSLGTSLSTNSSPPSLTELSLETEAYVREGVRLGDLLSDALVLLAREKVQHLAQRLSHSLSDIPEVVKKEKYKIEVRDLSLIILHGSTCSSSSSSQPAASLVVEVDVRTGKYLLSSGHLAFGTHLLADYQRDLDLFVSEVNNVQAEQLFAQHMARDRTSSVGALPAESVRTFEAVLRRLELIAWDKRVAGLGVMPVSAASVSSLSRSSSVLPSGCLAYGLGKWLSADCELWRADCTYRSALEPICREVVRSETSASIANQSGLAGKKRKADQISGKIDKSEDSLQDRKVHLFLLLVVDADLAVTAHAVLRAPITTAQHSPKQSLQFSEQTVCLGTCAYSEGEEEENRCVFLQEAAQEAYLWVRTKLLDSTVTLSDSASGARRGDEDLLLRVACVDGAPTAAVLESSGRLCVSFLSGRDEEVHALGLSVCVADPISCLAGWVAVSSATGLFATGKAGDDLTCELRVSLFERTADKSQQSCSPLAVLEAVSLGAALPAAGEGRSAVDSLQAVHEEFLKNCLQDVLSLSEKRLELTGLLAVIADIHLLVRLVAHLVRLRTVVSEDNTQSMQTFLRPVSHTVCSNSLSLTLAVHRVEDSALHLLAGYLEVTLRKEGRLGAEGPPATLSVRELTTDCAAATALSSNTIELVINSVVYSMCK